MTTRESIINVADDMIRQSGYNAFSFHDISKVVGIKTASVHYHFPTKTDLGIAVIRNQMDRIRTLREEMDESGPEKKLAVFLSLYLRYHAGGKVCLIGSLATELPSLGEELRNVAAEYTGIISDWITEILEEGVERGVFQLKTTPEIKALMIVSTMVAMVQLSRVTGDEGFKRVMHAILGELQPAR